MNVRRIGIIAYDGVQARDVCGPASVFAAANRLIRRKTAPYDVMLLGTGSHRTSLDTIIVPGGSALHPKTRAAVASWLRVHARRARRVASAWIGIHALAESGSLDGRACATHWRFATDLQQRWKEVRVDADAIFVREGKYYTSAGGDAGIDLALAFVEQDFGSELALQVAGELGASAA